MAGLHLRWWVVVAGLAVAVSPTLSAGTCHVMIANDDGIDAPGLTALAEALAADPAYRLTIVAPATSQSGQSHALVLDREIRVSRHAPIAGFPAWAVDATPATTVRMAIAVVLPVDLPRLVISGINRGENPGRIAWYSGTTGAAREAVVARLPGVAFSLALDWKDPRPDFAAAARLAKPVVDAVRKHPLPPGVLLNVNIPVDPANARGYRLSRMGLADDKVSAFDLMREEGDSRWYKGRWAPPTRDVSGTDNAALIEGWVAIAPLQLDQTAYGALPALRELDVLNDEAGQLSPVAHLLLWVFPTLLVLAVGARLVWQVRVQRSDS